MRRFEVYNNRTSEWKEINIQELKKGDLFRIFDNGVRYVNNENGQSTWKVVGDHYLRNEEGYLFIDCE